MPPIVIDRATAWKLGALVCAGGALLFVAGFLAGAGAVSGAAESVLREAQRVAVAGPDGAGGGPVLAPLRVPSGLSNVAHAGGSGSYSVQIGSYPDLASAERMARDARGRGLEARIVAEADGAGRTWHAVRIGRLPDRVAASLLASELRARHALPGYVVRDAVAAPTLEIAR